VLSPRRRGSKLIVMRRATFALASGLAAAVVAGALLYDRDSSPSSAAARPDQTDAVQPQQPPSAASERNGSDSASKEETAAQNQQPPGSGVNDEIRRLRRPEPDEATLRANIRKEATQEIRESYALLLEDLDVSPSEKEALLAVLVDIRVESTWSGTKTYEIRGRTVPQRERYERIAAVIGDQKLLEFLALEQNVRAYWETTQIARLLRRKDVPLTETQRDGVFEILVEVHTRYPFEVPPAELDRQSDEYIEHILTQTDDVDRHVVELAPSVLSPTQVAHLFNAYDFMSRDRRSSVEMQRKRRAGDQTFIKFGWSTPGRWPAEVMRD
jgi:hypothetical protein